MPNKLTYIGSVTAWEEDRSITTTPRVTPANVTFRLASDDSNSSSNAWGYTVSASSNIEGKATTSYLMTYLPGGNASYIFTEISDFDDLEGKKGTFITQGKGTFDLKAGAVTGTFNIVDGTGTADFAKITGKGSFGPAAPGSHDIKYNLEVDGISL